MKRKAPTSLTKMLGDKAQADKKIAAERPPSIQHNNNPFLRCPVDLKKTAYCFLQQAQKEGRRLATTRGESFPLSRPLVEIEARIGTLLSPFGACEHTRATSSGPKSVRGAVASAFLVNDPSATTRARFRGGVSRAHFSRWTGGGLSDPGPLSRAFGIRPEDLRDRARKGASRETESTETVYGGYPRDRRLVYAGDHRPGDGKRGRMEEKRRLEVGVDLALPAATYDLRVSLATETTVDDDVSGVPPSGHDSRRLKRRRSYRDNAFAWCLDVTEVTTTNTAATSTSSSRAPESAYEIEFELLPNHTIKLLNETDPNKVLTLCRTYAEQLNFMIGQINPSSDVLDVDSYIVEHSNSNAVKLALAQCAALKRFMDSKQTNWRPAVAEPGSEQQTPKIEKNQKFVGCMPVNFSRHNIEEVQRATGGYYLSEKTDGVRYLMVFTGGGNVVLVDRALGGNQPKCDGAVNPFAAVAPLVQPGTVLDGEVVMHRKLRRPVFIVFDVMCRGSEPVLHLPFEERLRHLDGATFRVDGDRDPFANSVAALRADRAPLPLVRKRFVRRTELDRLLGRVREERGVRVYAATDDGGGDDLHHHLTDGVIFQPNAPYVCGTDVRLLKWKYLDTVTIDVEILPLRERDDDDALRVGVLGDENSMVDVSRFVRLPPGERARLEADRRETGARVAEVGFDPETGEWYYSTMRPDKTGSNHISTVIGTLLELAESLDTTELRYRMSVRTDGRDTYRKDVRGMMKQLLEHQRRANHNSSSGGGGR